MHAVLSSPAEGADVCTRVVGVPQKNVVPQASSGNLMVSRNSRVVWRERERAAGGHLSIYSYIASDIESRDT